jgi:hypothetical protein
VVKAKFISTEGDYLLAEIVVQDQSLYVMDDFGGERFSSGESVTVELVNSFSEELDWDAVFGANRKKER